MSRFSLKGLIGLDGSRWRAGLAQAEKQADVWGRSVARTVQSHLLAAFSIQGALRTASVSIERFRQSLESSGDLVRQAQRADLGSMFAGSDERDKLIRSIELIQEMRFALQKSKIDPDRVDDIFQDISTRRIEALEGFDEGKVNDQARAFGNLGIGEKELRAMTGPQLLFLLSTRLKGSKESDEIKEAMDALFSDAGVDFLVLMRKGLKDAMDEARKEGVVLTGEEVLSRDRQREREFVEEERTRVAVERENKKPGGFFSWLKRLYVRSFFEVLGRPGDVAFGVGGAAAEFLKNPLPGFEPDGHRRLNLSDFAPGTTTRRLQERLEERQMLREIAKNTQQTTENTDVLRN